MPLTRWIVSCKAFQADDATDAIVNTLYFNVSGSVDDPNYTSLGDDLWALWAARPWAAGRFLDVRGYDMADAKPRPVKYMKRQVAPGSILSGGAQQVALCLSYFADRNLPRQRGRLYLGPWTINDRIATQSQMQAVMALPPLLADLGGVNVDWSLWSPTNQQATRINHAWTDNSWDIIRSRKIAATLPRLSWTGNG